MESNSSVWEPDLSKTTSHCLKLTIPMSLEHRQGTAFTFHLRGCDSLNFLLGILLIFLGNHRYKMLLLSANQSHEALLDFHFLQLKWWIPNTTKIVSVCITLKVNNSLDLNKLFRQGENL